MEKIVHDSPNKDGWYSLGQYISQLADIGATEKELQKLCKLGSKATLKDIAKVYCKHTKHVQVKKSKRYKSLDKIYAKEFKGLSSPGITTFSKKLQAVMKLQGWTVKSLAKELNVSKSTVQRWITHYTYPTVNILVKLCNATNVSADWYLGIR